MTFNTRISNNIITNSPTFTTQTIKFGNVLMCIMQSVERE